MRENSTRPRPAQARPGLAFHALAGSARLDLGLAAADTLHLVHASGRGLQLDMPAGWLAVWIPLHGATQFSAPGVATISPAGEFCPWQLPAGSAFVSRGSGLQARTRAPASFLCIGGPSGPWAALLRALPGAPAPADVFARQWTCPRPLRRAAVGLARQVRAGQACAGPPRARPLYASSSSPEVALREFARALLDAQLDLQPLVERCNGRTPQRRRLTLQRLLRTHALIERDPEARLELAQLARSANYSPWHLIRMYREVFGETPSEHAARLRLEHAWSMVRNSAMPVCVITQHLGYESQSAFCRAFKNAFGLTTTQVRHLPLQIVRPIRVHTGLPRARSRANPRSQALAQRSVT